MIGLRLPAFAEANQDKNKKGRPTKKKRAHEPVRELDDMIDLEAMLGSVRRLAEKFVDQREAIHCRPNLPSIARAAAAAFGRVSKFCN